MGCFVCFSLHFCGVIRLFTLFKILYCPETIEYTVVSGGRIWMMVACKAHEEMLTCRTLWTLVFYERIWERVLRNCLLCFCFAGRMTQAHVLIPGMPRSWQRRSLLRERLPKPQSGSQSMKQGELFWWFILSLVDRSQYFFSYHPLQAQRVVHSRRSEHSASANQSDELSEKHGETWASLTSLPSRSSFPK